MTIFVTFSMCDAYRASIPLFNHCIAVIADAYKIQSNIKDDKDGKERRALQSYLKYGYIPLENKAIDLFSKEEQVSRTLECAYDDYCLARIVLKQEIQFTAKNCLIDQKNYSSRKS